MSQQFLDRPVETSVFERLVAQGMDATLARLHASRTQDPQTAWGLPMQDWPRPETMLGLTHGAQALARAIRAGERLCIVADYDCDGATACAVLVLGLRRLGANVGYVVPNRFRHGYGLGRGVVDEIAQGARAQWLITVDQGITSVEGVAHAQALGMQVIVTDHHLPGDRLPEAYAVIDPHQPGCSFASRAIAGVGVAFYLLLGVRSALSAAHCRLDDLLPLVALGTVADLAPLDALNRSLVEQGLHRMRKGVLPIGLAALMQVSAVDARHVIAPDLGYRLGPRINAAGRLESMRAGIECLTASSLDHALKLATALDATNTERRSIEKTMREQALDLLGEAPAPGQAPVLWNEGWHEGVVGLVATRLREHSKRPAFALAPAHEAEPGLWRGSGRSIAGFHLRDALQRIDAKAPGVLVKFGGHAMAAGLSIHCDALERFAQLFRDEAHRVLGSGPLEQQIWHDGPMPAQPSLDWASSVQATVWGQAYPEPLFVQTFLVRKQWCVKAAHLACRLVDPRDPGAEIEAIWFDRIDPLPQECELAFHLQVDRYAGKPRLKLLLQDLVPREPPSA